MNKRISDKTLCIIYGTFAVAVVLLGTAALRALGF